MSEPLVQIDFDRPFGALPAMGELPIIRSVLKVFWGARRKQTALLIQAFTGSKGR